jgi:methyl-accepting chemotaxis protein
MNSAIFCRHTRKSYGGSIQNDLKAQENILKKLQLNLKWKNVRQFTHNQRAAMPQKIANQQKIVNDLRQKAASAAQSTGILNALTQKVNEVANSIKTNVSKVQTNIQSTNTVNKSVNAANQAVTATNAANQAKAATNAANKAKAAANAALKQTQHLKKLANNAEQIAKNLRSLQGGSRRKRRNTYRK